MNKSHDVAPLADYGFFGPGSVTWKVQSYPTAFTVGFQRTVVTEMFEPFLLASVNDTQAVMTRPGSRYDRTLQYMATIAFGDSQSALKSSDVLVKIHTKVVGTEPISGLPYDANDPQAQLWIHLTAWHSVLYTYEKFGPGKLTAEEEAQYWAECARAAQFQTIDVTDVPRSRDEMRAYYARMRPILAATEATQQHVDFLLNAVPDDAPWLLVKASGLLFRRATIATLPRWMRKMGGIKQSRTTDAVVTVAMRILMRIATGSVGLQRFILHRASPLSVPIVDPMLCGVPPKDRRTWTPAEARSHYGYRAPAEQYTAIKAARAGKPLPAHAPRDGSRPLLAFNA
jgi:uncharacterized protein (DUF2236 family)